MKIINGYIEFEHLSRRSEHVVGEKLPIKAKMLKMVPNSNLAAIEMSGRIAAGCLRNLFAQQ